MRSKASHVRSLFKALERRADHLAKRIAASDIDLSYDKQELAALRWALDNLYKLFADILKEEKT